MCIAKQLPAITSVRENSVLELHMWKYHLGCALLKGLALRELQIRIPNADQRYRNPARL